MKNLIVAAVFSLFSVISVAAEVICVEVEIPIYGTKQQSAITDNKPFGLIANIAGSIIAPGQFSTLVNTTNQIIDMVTDNDGYQIIGYQIEIQCWVNQNDNTD